MLPCYREQEMCGRVKVPASRLCEIVKVKLQLLWRPQDIEDARNACPLRKHYVQSRADSRERDGGVKAIPILQEPS